MSNLIEMPKPDDLPEAYIPKIVTDVASDNEAGWLVQLSCGDIIWCAAHPGIGAKMYCSVCLHHLLQDTEDAIQGFLNRKKGKPELS